jgi:predicted nucleotidyltransferase
LVRDAGNAQQSSAGSTSEQTVIQKTHPKNWKRLEYSQKIVLRKVSASPTPPNLIREMRDIVSVVTYFDLFNYPVMADEIRTFLPAIQSNDSFNESLEMLLAEGTLYQVDAFVSLQNKPELASKRIQMNICAKRRMKTARKVAGILSWFPFVRSLSISGSLSKDCADANSDIDFFIITKAGRLWICRTLMHLLKKLSFLIGQQHCFCMNYYIDDQEMAIREKNFYTAIEVLTLVPLYGARTHESFINSNRWTTKLCPNAIPRPQARRQTERSIYIKRVFESILSWKVFDTLETRLMTTTVNRWKEKTDNQQKNMRGVVLAMDAGPHHAKPHPANFQQKLLARYEERLAKVLAGSPTLCDQSFLTVVRD